tara:strand:+ start:144 stop:434 length:291 start_codon:yes stop_codon:yes gene_type:complete
MKKENPFEYSKTVSLIDFIISLGANTCKLIRNPKTSLRFFVVDGTEVTGKVSKRVEELSSDLSVSWVTPKDGGEASYLIHPSGGGGNVESEYSVKT